MGNSISSILEVGCGTGDILRVLARNNFGKKLFGVEIGTLHSDEKMETIGTRPIQIGPYDGKNLPFDDESFDFVFASHVLEHVVDERPFLSELRRVSSK